MRILVRLRADKVQVRELFPRTVSSDYDIELPEDGYHELAHHLENLVAASGTIRRVTTATIVSGFDGTIDVTLYGRMITEYSLTLIEGCIETMLQRYATVS